MALALSRSSADSRGVGLRDSPQLKGLLPGLDQRGGSLLAVTGGRLTHAHDVGLGQAPDLSRLLLGLDQRGGGCLLTVAISRLTHADDVGFGSGKQGGRRVPGLDQRGAHRGVTIPVSAGRALCPGKQLAARSFYCDNVGLPVPNDVVARCRRSRWNLACVLRAALGPGDLTATCAPVTLVARCRYGSADLVGSTHLAESWLAAARQIFGGPNGHFESLTAPRTSDRKAESLPSTLPGELHGADSEQRIPRGALADALRGVVKRPKSC